MSETVDVAPHLFRPVDKKHRIYEPRAVRERRLPSVGSEGALARTLGLHGRRSARAPIGAGNGIPVAPAERPKRSGSARGASCT